MLELLPEGLEFQAGRVLRGLRDPQEWGISQITKNSLENTRRVGMARLDNESTMVPGIGTAFPRHGELWECPAGIPGLEAKSSTWKCPETHPEFFGNTPRPIYQFTRENS